MTDTLSLDRAARTDAGSLHDIALAPRSGDGVPDGARFQNMLAEAVQARDEGDASDPGAPASAGSAGVAPPQAGDGKPAASGMLGAAWDWTRQRASAVSQKIGDFDAAHDHVLTRVAGVVQAGGAVAEGLTGAAVAGVGGAATATGVGAAPGVGAMVGGGALVANALDNAVAGACTALSGEFHHTLSSQAAGAGARALGASERTAERVTAGVDLAQGVAAGGASVAAGLTRKEVTKSLETATSKTSRVTAAMKGDTQADLVDELVKNGAKVTSFEVVGATRMPSGQIAFLERGTSSSGLQHIIERHGVEFAQAGVPEDKIPTFLMKTLESGKVIGLQGRRPIYEVDYEGRTLRAAITVGNNGYVVGANMK